MTRLSGNLSADANRKYDLLLKKNMLDDFSIDAGWMPIKSYTNLLTDKDKFKYGTLNYKNGSMTLDLFQGWPLKHGAITFGTKLRRIDNIFGCIADSNMYYVFIPNIAKSDTLDLHLAITKQSWNLIQFSITDYLPYEKVTLNNLILDYNMLDKWIAPAQKFVFKDDMSLSIVSSDNIFLSNFTFKGQVFNVFLVGDISQKSKNKNRNVIYTNKSYLLIEGEDNISTSDAIYFATEFRKILSVILACPVNTTQLSKRGIKRDKATQVSEDVYFLETRSQKEMPELSAFYTFQFNTDINFSKIVSNWFNASSELKLLIQDYLLTVNYTMSMQNMLINLTQGVEAFYRKEKVISRKKAKKYQRNLYLLEKIEKMLSTFSNEFINTIEKDIGMNINKWAKLIKNTRVFIVHGNKKGKIIENTTDLWHSVQLLQYLVQVFILQELGMINLSEQKEFNQIDKIFSSEII
ncbi:HEPN domain-containing protein [Lactobacillus taiwanensis]|uniref:HEPN domain-containing protein n=1 Tax=Lactobacillus taiwanensis TaxID=508451 RepID=UPI00070D64C1|nr:HEPN domain-containing protein [Lactobacillus taiwanensis]